MAHAKNIFDRADVEFEFELESSFLTFDVSHITLNRSTCMCLAIVPVAAAYRHSLAGIENMGSNAAPLRRRSTGTGTSKTEGGAWGVFVSPD